MCLECMNIKEQKKRTELYLNPLEPLDLFRSDGWGLVVRIPEQLCVLTSLPCDIRKPSAGQLYTLLPKQFLMISLSASSCVWQILFGKYLVNTSQPGSANTHLIQWAWKWPQTSNSFQINTEQVNLHASLPGSLQFLSTSSLGCVLDIYQRTRPCGTEPISCTPPAAPSS